MVYAHSGVTILSPDHQRLRCKFNCAPILVPPTALHLSACNPSTWDVKTGSQVQGQPGLYRPCLRKHAVPLHLPVCPFTDLPPSGCRDRASLPLETQFSSPREDGCPLRVSDWKGRDHTAVCRTPSVAQQALWGAPKTDHPSDRTHWQ